MRQRAQPPLFLVSRRRRKWLRRHLRRRRVERARSRQRAATEVLVHHAGAYVLKVPKYFGLLRLGSHKRLVKFLRKLVRLTLQKERHVCIDFGPLEKCYSDGTLLFYAELQRILRRRPGCMTCKPPRDKVAAQVLSHLGVLRQLGVPRLIKSSREDVLHWEVLTGTNADATKLGPAIEKLPHLDEAKTSQLFRSVTEALTNVTQHAYGGARDDGSAAPGDSGWWMFVRQEPAQLDVMFCDLGLGVPYTVLNDPKHKKWFKDRINAALKALGSNQHNDGEIIQVTVDEKRSRVKEAHRGKGFGNMVETIESNPGGRLVIFSNRGAYNFSRQGDREVVEVHNYVHSIYGTLIAWHISLPNDPV